MSVALQMTNSDGYADSVAPMFVDLDQELNQPASLTCTFETGLSTYEDETSATNPCQLRAGLTFTRNARQEFEGSIRFKTINKLGAGRWEITVTGLDRLADGQRCRASQSDEDVWEIDSASAALSQVVSAQPQE